MRVTLALSGDSVIAEVADTAWQPPVQSKEDYGH